jgi:hypothetical protein
MSSDPLNALIVWSDEEGTDAAVIKLLSFDKESNVFIPVNTFLQISSDKDTWVLVVKEPNRNLPLGGLGRTDPRLTAAMRRVAAGKLEQSFLGSTVQMYVTEPIGMIVDGVASPILYRPKDGLKAVKACELNVTVALRLPKAKASNVIGHIDGTEIPVALNKRVIDHNAIVAGTIGSGKTETVGRIVSVLNGFEANGTYPGHCVFMLDHKPDYQDLTSPNDFGPDPAGFPEEVVQMWTLGDPKPGENVISIPFSEVNREFLLETCLFPGDSDDKQRAVFGLLFDAYAEDHKDQYWSLQDFMEWFNNTVTREKNGGRELTEMGRGIFKGANVHQAILATAYKLPCRVPKWIDRDNAGSSSILKIQKKNYSNFLENSEVFQAGRINVINVTNCSSSEYAMFTVTLLNFQLKGRASGKIEAWIANIIDEAQDIFNGGESLRKIAVKAFEEITRKGRSKHVGSFFCVQAFTEIPDNIVNYCNTRIIMRHGAKPMAIKALEGNDYAAGQTTTFCPGDAFVRVYGSPTYVKARMLPSPFLISKEQNPEDYAE